MTSIHRNNNLSSHDVVNIIELGNYIRLWVHMNAVLPPLSPYSWERGDVNQEVEGGYEAGKLKVDTGIPSS
jgi:hypothetical protein